MRRRGVWPASATRRDGRSRFWLVLAMRDPRVSLDAVDRLAAWAGARPGAAYGEIATAACEVER